jgi:hypothetical protein
MIFKYRKEVHHDPPCFVAMASSLRMPKEPWSNKRKKEMG